MKHVLIWWDSFQCISIRMLRSAPSGPVVCSGDLCISACAAGTPHFGGVHGFCTLSIAGLLVRGTSCYRLVDRTTTGCSCLEFYYLCTSLPHGPARFARGLHASRTRASHIRHMYTVSSNHSVPAICRCPASQEQAGKLTVAELRIT